MFGNLDFRCLGFHLQVEHGPDKFRGVRPALKVKLGAGAPLDVSDVLDFRS